jgi:hypothetical protein
MTHARSFSRPLLALALCAITGAAMAQSTSATGTPGTGTTAPSATGTPMTTPATPMTSSGQSGLSQRLPSRTDSADSTYRSLDAQHRGYLSKTDVQTIRGFSFEAADTNHDGRLTREEFARAWSSQQSN